MATKNTTRHLEHKLLFYEVKILFNSSDFQEISGNVLAFIDLLSNSIAHSNYKWEEPLYFVWEMDIHFHYLETFLLIFLNKYDIFHYKFHKDWLIDWLIEEQIVWDNTDIRSNALAKVVSPGGSGVHLLCGIYPRDCSICWRKKRLKNFTK